MTDILVYRLESREGLGPFTYEKHGIKPQLTEDLYIPIYAMPAPNQDKYSERMQGKSVYGHYHFGCDSLESINNWFNRKVREIFHANDLLVLSVYKVDEEDTINTGNQVLFKRDKSNKIGEVSLISF